MPVSNDKPLAERDYFKDATILRDPYAYFEALRSNGPVYTVPDSGVVMVTGFAETIEVLVNRQDFSSAIAVQGAAARLPFEPEGDDLTTQIEMNRPKFHAGESIVAIDDQQHSSVRSLISRLFTPSRLKANEKFITAFADELVTNAVASGRAELIGSMFTPFVTIVIADLLGIPAEDRQLFMDWIEQGPPPGSLDGANLHNPESSQVKMAEFFVGYIQRRISEPREDVLSELAQATLADGSKPRLMDLVRLATFMFGAGQDTSAKLLGNAMRFIAEMPDLQRGLRDDPALLPSLIEEVLRLEGSTKMTSRLARRPTRIGGQDIAAGTKVMLALAAANRDPSRWPEPGRLDTGRPRIKEHVAFGRGAHVCAGAPLARVEVRVLLEKLLAKTSWIALDEQWHGTSGDRRLDYEPSFIIRGLSNLHVVFTPD